MRAAAVSARRPPGSARRGCAASKPSASISRARVAQRARRSRIVARCSKTFVDRAEVGDGQGSRAASRRSATATRSTASRSMSGGGVGGSTMSAGSIAHAGRRRPRTPAGVLVQVGDVVRGVARACRRRGSRRPARRRAARGCAPRARARPRPTGAACRRRTAGRRSPSSREGSTRCGAPRSCTYDLEVGPAAHQRPGRAGVVEVDVGQQQRARRLAAKRLDQRLHRRLGPGVDEHVAHLPAADNALAPQVADVDRPDVHVAAGEPTPVESHPMSAAREHRLAEPDRPVDDAHVRGALDRAALQRALPQQPGQGPDRPVGRLRPAHPDRLRPRPRAGPRRGGQGRRAGRPPRRHGGADGRHPARRDEHVDDDQRDGRLAAGALRRRRRGAGRRAVGAPGHDAERHHQGVPVARHLRVPARAVDAADRRHGRLHGRARPEVEPDQHLLLPPAGGGGDAGAGDRLLDVQRDRRPGRRARARAAGADGRGLRAHLVLRQRRRALRRGARQAARDVAAVGRAGPRALRRRGREAPALPLRRAGQLARA